MLSLYDIAVGLRFICQIPYFFRSPWTKSSALSAMQTRLRNRDQTFLQIARQSIYSHQRGPYARLLRHAGLKLADLEELVNKEQLEGALKILFENGIFLTVDEFKGRRPVVRGSLSMQVNPDLLRNPNSRFHVPALTSGSRGKATPVLQDLELLKTNSCATLLGRNYAYGKEWEQGIWFVPGGIPMGALLANCLNGMDYTRWFSQVDPELPGMHSRYRHSVKVIRWGAALGGHRLPKPEYAPVQDPQPVLDWMQEVLRRGQRPHVVTLVSSGVSLSKLARAQKVDLTGAVLTLGGEPFTRARHKRVSQTGARAIPDYGAMEVGYFGSGCLNPVEIDEIHVQSDRFGLIQAGAAGAAHDLPPKALLFTPLSTNAPFVMINCGTGDMAELSERDCGCPSHRWGWNKHLNSITSYEKMTAGGVALLQSDLSQVLEEVLPAAFGGGPTDYQLVEEEGPGGDPCLRLLVSPIIGQVDTRIVRDTFLQAISRGDEAYKLMSRMVQEADYLKVESAYPRITTGGKVLQVAKRHPEM